MRKILCLIIVVSILLSGCATPPSKISAAYVSPLKYKDYDCDQIIMEMDYISQRVNTLYASLKKEANSDAAQMGIGMLLFWPTLFMLEGGDGPEATEYAQLKGEYQALRQVAVQRKCSLELLPPSPEELVKAAEKDSKENLKKARARRP